MYINGLFVCAITKQLNNKNALNRYWQTTPIDRMLSNYIYAGDYQHRKRIKDEEISIKMQMDETKVKLNNLNLANKNINNKEELKLYTNLFQLKRLKNKSYYVRKNGLWDKLTKEQKKEQI